MNKTHSVDVCLTALKIQKEMQGLRKEIGSSNDINLSFRIGIHTGPVTAGVIGKTKSAYDMWGDAVNVASRMEMTGVGDRINISAETYPKIKDFFAVEERGELEIKNRGKMGMYFINGILPDLSVDGKGVVPSAAFTELYNKLK